MSDEKQTILISKKAEEELRDFFNNVMYDRDRPTLSFEDLITALRDLRNYPNIMLVSQEPSPGHNGPKSIRDHYNDANEINKKNGFGKKCVPIEVSRKTAKSLELEASREGLEPGDIVENLLTVVELVGWREIKLPLLTKILNT